MTCPWHGSRFRLADGSVVAGPATVPQPAYEARRRGDALEVRRFGWVLEGRIVARGPDNEPLVDSVRPVARLAGALIQEARAHYEKRFGAGRSS